jgi:hypothetical protein
MRLNVSARKRRAIYAGASAFTLALSATAVGLTAGPLSSPATAAKPAPSSARRASAPHPVRTAARCVVASTLSNGITKAGATGAVRHSPRSAGFARRQLRRVGSTLRIKLVASETHAFAPAAARDGPSRRPRQSDARRVLDAARSARPSAARGRCLPGAGADPGRRSLTAAAAMCRLRTPSVSLIP